MENTLKQTTSQLQPSSVEPLEPLGASAAATELELGAELRELSDEEMLSIWGGSLLITEGNWDELPEVRSSSGTLNPTITIVTPNLPSSPSSSPSSGSSPSQPWPGSIT